MSFFFTCNLPLVAWGNVYYPKLANHTSTITDDGQVRIITPLNFSLPGAKPPDPLRPHTSCIMHALLPFPCWDGWQLDRDQDGMQDPTTPHHTPPSVNHTHKSSLHHHHHQPDPVHRVNHPHSQAYHLGTPTTTTSLPLKLMAEPQ